MYDSHAKGISYSAGLFMLIAFFIAGMMLAGLLSTAAWTAMTGENISRFKDAMTNPDYADAYKMAQAIAAICNYLLPALLTAWLLHRRPLRLLGFSAGITPAQAGLSVLIILVALFVSTSLAYFNHIIPVPADWRIRFDAWEADYNRQVEAIVSLKTNTDYLIALVVMAFLPALCEETLFRGGLQNFLARSTGNHWIAVIVVSLAFSLLHFSYYGFLSRFFLGMVLGLIFWYSGKLWLSILAHFVNNALALSVLFYYTKQGKTLTEATQESNSNWWGIFILPLLIGLFMYFKKITASNKPGQLSA